MEKIHLSLHSDGLLVGGQHSRGGLPGYVQSGILQRGEPHLMELEVMLGQSEARPISSKSSWLGPFIDLPELEQKRVASGSLTISSCSWETISDTCKRPAY